MTNDPAIWRDDGHLTQAATSAAADGQLTDADALAHVASCGRCLHVVGRVASAATELTQLLTSLRRERAVGELFARRRRLSLATTLVASAAVAVFAFAWGRSTAPAPPPSSAFSMAFGPTSLRLRAPELPVITRRTCLSLELR